jgi:hypothetical protein
MVIPPAQSRACTAVPFAVLCLGSGSLLARGMWVGVKEGDFGGFARFSEFLGRFPTIYGNFYSLNLRLPGPGSARDRYWS